MGLDYLLGSIINIGSGNVFYSFSNADGKKWIMPINNMRLAMNLYQPSGKKGKLLKALFPRFYKIHFIQKVIHAEKVQCLLDTELEKLLCDLFKVENLKFSIFCGTPGIHQKITMQIFDDSHILGYCKVTGSNEIAALFRREADLLDFLKIQGLQGLPKSLFCGELKDGASFFVQSTTKTRNSKVPHKWCNLHEQFLNELQRRTVQKITFERSDCYETLQALLSHIDWLPKFIDKIFIKSVINNVLIHYIGTIVEFSVYHADFTPWNMYVENKQLFVFDWEYACKTYPPMLDKYHFFVQTAIFEKHWDSKEIINYLKSYNANWVNKELLILYLLDIISRYTMREKGSIEGDVANSMKIWNDLLIYLHQ